MASPIHDENVAPLHPQSSRASISSLSRKMQRLLRLLASASQMENPAQRVVLSSSRIGSVVTLQIFKSKTAKRKRLEVLRAQKTIKVGRTVNFL